MLTSYLVTFMFQKTKKIVLDNNTVRILLRESMHSTHQKGKWALQEEKWETIRNWQLCVLLYYAELYPSYRADLALISMSGLWHKHQTNKARKPKNKLQHSSHHLTEPPGTSFLLFHFFFPSLAASLQVPSSLTSLKALTSKNTVCQTFIFKSWYSILWVGISLTC